MNEQQKPSLIVLIIDENPEEVRRLTQVAEARDAIVFSTSSLSHASELMKGVQFDLVNLSLNVAGSFTVPDLWEKLGIFPPNKRQRLAMRTQFLISSDKPFDEQSKRLCDRLGFTKYLPRPIQTQEIFEQLNQIETAKIKLRENLLSQ